MDQQWQSVREYARELMAEAAVEHEGRFAGTVASRDHSVDDLLNYDQVFVRDCAISCFWYLLDGQHQRVRDHLSLLADLQYQEVTEECFQPPIGAMPVSFRVDDDELFVDYGSHAIARVAPVDSIFWYLVVLRAYAASGHDPGFATSERIQSTIRRALDLLLSQQVTLYPVLFVPEGSFMIDRRLGVYGHPLEVQVLFHAALSAARDLLVVGHDDKDATCQRAGHRRQLLRAFVNDHYWLDHEAVERVHHYQSEGYGGEVDNPFNIQPRSIARWVPPWVRDGAGFLAGNVGPGRLDCRFFTGGNLLAGPMGLIDSDRSASILHLIDRQWSRLAAEMPLKIVFPAVYGRDWILLTGRDPKNSPWSYHNGGGWPMFLCHLALAATTGDRLDLLERALSLATPRVMEDGWPEYYDGEHHDLVGRRSRRRQTWSAAGWLIADHLLQRPEDVQLVLPSESGKQAES